MRDQRRSPFRAAQSICSPSPSADHSTSLEGSSFGATRRRLVALATSYSRASTSSHGLTDARLPQIGRHGAWQYALRKDFHPPARTCHKHGWMACGAPCLPGDADHRAASVPISAFVLASPVSTLDSRRARHELPPQRCDLDQAAKVYARGRRGSYHLVSADF